MAKYSKEQRRCAVELYVQYECCAADVIRELGYPSREVWYRELGKVLSKTSHPQTNVALTN